MASSSQELGQQHLCSETAAPNTSKAEENKKGGWRRNAVATTTAAAAKRSQTHEYGERVCTVCSGNNNLLMLFSSESHEKFATRHG